MSSSPAPESERLQQTMNRLAAVNFEYAATLDLLMSRRPPLESGEAWLSWAKDRVAIIADHTRAMAEVFAAAGFELEAAQLRHVVDELGSNSAELTQWKAEREIELLDVVNKVLDRFVAAATGRSVSMPSA